MVSVHTCLTPLLQAEVEHYGGRAWWNRVTHLMVAGEQSEKEGAENRYILPGHVLSVLHPPTRHCLSIISANYEFINGLVH